MTDGKSFQNNKLTMCGHAIDRLKERYALEPTEEIGERLFRYLESYRLKPLIEKKGTLTLKIPYKDILITAVIALNRKGRYKVITFYPKRELYMPVK